MRERTLPRFAGGVTKGVTGGVAKGVAGGVTKGVVCGALVIFIVCLGGSSCRTLGAVFRQPSVSLRSVDIAGISLEGIQLLCSVEVENPNLFSLSYPEIGWEIFVKGGSFLSGTAPDGEAISPGSTRILEIPLDISHTALAAAAGYSGTLKEIDYQIVLETRFLLPVQGEWIVDFERQGKFPLIQTISFRDPSFEITGLDFDGLDIRFSLNVDNPNPFPIPFPGISYNYEVWNNDFITGAVEHPAVLAAGGLSPVSIELRVVYSDLYRSFSALKSIGEAGCLLSLRSRVSLPGLGETYLVLDIPGTLPLLQAPVLSFKGISVKHISLSKLDLEFGWNVDNPNTFGFDAGDMYYEFLVNDNPWVQDQIEEKTKIAPGGKTSILISVSLNSSSQVKELTDIITRGKDVVYDLKGSVTFSSGPAGFSNSPIPFDLKGRTRLRL
jgi:LEA14-like dessication related protein